MQPSREKRFTLLHATARHWKNVGKPLASFAAAPPPLRSAEQNPQPPLLGAWPNLASTSTPDKIFLGSSEFLYVVAHGRADSSPELWLAFLHATSLPGEAFFLDLSVFYYERESGGGWEGSIT